jgi:CheY-like chemotaxis protein
MTTQTHLFEGLRTLIVDDNDIARTVIARTAQSLHLRSDTACNAVDAVTKIEAAEHHESDPYQLVLMDWRMPDINGLEATTMIKADTLLQQVPAVVMVSAYRKDEIIDPQQQNCVDGFISKPVSQSRLFNTLADIFSDQIQEPELSTSTVASLESDDIDHLLSGRHLLLAEDNIVNQKVAAGILKKKKVRVTIANNGYEAIALMRKYDGQFDAVLMDIEMPEMDGFEATRAIRNGCHYPQIPIIALTAQALKGDRERCLNANMNGYISKPVAPNKLYDTLAKLLKEKQQ